MTGACHTTGARQTTRARKTTGARQTTATRQTTGARQTAGARQEHVRPQAFIASVSLPSMQWPEAVTIFDLHGAPVRFRAVLSLRF